MSDIFPDPPECSHGIGHHWVGGRFKKGAETVTIVSRQCRHCGYEQDIPEEYQMEITRADNP